MHAESTLSTFIASDGDNIVIQDWPLAPSVALKGMVIVVHDLGEHAGRYERLARTLNDWGFAVRGYDQCGHGESGGARGSMPTENRLLDDLTDIVDSTRLRLHKDTPLILLGHGLGVCNFSNAAGECSRSVIPGVRWGFEQSSKTDFGDAVQVCSQLPVGHWDKATISLSRS
jgi:alpha-beta hydrolase superfamily lysophospholipase